MMGSAPAEWPICLLGDEQIAAMSLIQFPRQSNRLTGQYTCWEKGEDQDVDILIGLAISSLRGNDPWDELPHCDRLS